MTAGDSVRVQTFVRVPIDEAFDVFTLELDRWWRRGPAWRVGGQGALHLEPRLGGRVFQEYGPAHRSVFEMGRITKWERPSAFAFTWRGITFAPDDPSTLVEVDFEASGEGTRVTLRHSGFAALRDGHPVRHGQTPTQFTSGFALWWSALATAYREHSERTLP